MTDNPASLDVTHAATPPVGSSSFLVHMKSGGSDVDQAYIYLWKGDEAYLNLK